MSFLFVYIRVDFFRPIDEREFFHIIINLEFCYPVDSSVLCIDTSLKVMLRLIVYLYTVIWIISAFKMPLNPGYVVRVPFVIQVINDRYHRLFTLFPHSEISSLLKVFLSLLHFFRCELPLEIIMLIRPSELLPDILSNMF